MIAINDINDSLPPNIQSALYVDDYVIYASGSIPHMLERRLQTAINKLSQWSNKTGFTFSTDKTVSMHICRKRNCPKLAHNLSIYNKSIKCVDKQVFLGLTIDNSLTWKYHIQKLKLSCYRKLDLLKHLTHKRWGADRTTLLRLYIMLIKPKLDYGCEVYSSACKSLLDKLDPVQSRAVRVATGAFKSSPVVSLLSESGIKPLVTYRNIKILNYLARIMVNRNHPLYDETNHRINEMEVTGNEDYGKCFVDRAIYIMKQHELNFENIIIEQASPTPPWVININICQELYTLKKKDLSQVELKNKFTCHDRAHNIEKSYFTDGSKTEHGVGYAYMSGGNIIANRIDDLATIFTAELYAINDSLEHHKYNNPNSEMLICSDSRSAIVAIGKLYNKHPLIQKIQQMCGEDVKVTLCWVPSHVGVKQNEQVDEAARAVIDNNMTYQNIPKTDYKVHIKKKATEKWADAWNHIHTNKLKDIKPTVIPFKKSCFTDRSWEIKVTRLRIGHTHLTHGYLMDGSPPPLCGNCAIQLSVKHILKECPQYSANRANIFGHAASLALILGDSSVEIYGKLYKFLIKINIFKKI